MILQVTLTPDRSQAISDLQSACDTIQATAGNLTFVFRSGSNIITVTGTGDPITPNATVISVEMQTILTDPTAFDTVMQANSPNIVTQQFDFLEAETGGYSVFVLQPDALSTSQAGVTAKPQFQYFPKVANSDQVTIQGVQTGAGDSTITIPFRILDNTGEFLENRQIVVTDDWTIDLTQSTINMGTFVGGIIDGSGAQAANIDYLLWAFLDDTQPVGSQFQGFGVTRRPQITGITAPAGATPGATGVVFTTGFAANAGWRFAVGSSVVIRKGITGLTGVQPTNTAGSKYNQGIITAQTSTSITVDLDASYGVAFESNVDLSAEAALEILQLDNFQPRMWTQDSVYPGSGAEYQFQYLGMIQTDPNNHIRNYRKPGDLYVFPARYRPLNKTMSAAQTFVICLSRWTPRNVKLMTGRMFVSNAIGTGLLNAAWLYADTTTPDSMLAESDLLEAITDSGFGFVSGNNSFTTIVSAAALQFGLVTVSITGHYWEEW